MSNPKCGGVFRKIFEGVGVFLFGFLFFVCFFVFF